MPRRYHRPPAVKRRKSRRPGAPYPYEEASPGDGTAVGEPALDDAEGGAWDESDDYEDDEPAVPAAVATQPKPAAGREASRHIQKDYSYVRSELMRILALAVFLFVALVITAILR